MRYSYTLTSLYRLFSFFFFFFNDTATTEIYTLSLHDALPTLVSKHFQNRWIPDDQCYTCHTGYGLSGNIQAKIGGLSHVTHEYFTGVPKEIKIHRPFNVDTCLHCHGESAK